MESKKKKLFQGYTAWFSSSVAKETIKLWRSYGGTLDLLDHAQFVFSEDNQAEDTSRIYESEAYMDEHLAVFHAKYITDCINKRVKSALPVGRYHLLPASIHRDVRNMSKPDKENVAESSSSSSEGEDEQNTSMTSRLSPEKNSSPKHPQRRQSNKFNLREPYIRTDIVHINDLPKVTGKLEDLIPGEDGCTVSLKQFL